MGVVLGHAADPGQAVHHAGHLVAVDTAELEQPQRQLPVRPAAGTEDQTVHRAVHRLQVVVLALPLDRAVGMELLIQVHRRKHAVGIEAEVAGDLEQLRLGDVRGVDEVVPGGDVPLARVVLHHRAQDAALGMEHGQAGADLVREGEQVEFAAELAVITLGRLLQPGQVRLQGVPARPGRAVQPLQGLVGLIAPPVRGRGAHQRDGRDVAGVRDVRPAAEVLPGHRVVAAQVVIDRQLALADLDTGTVVGGRRALVGDQFQLVRLVGQLGPGLVVADRPAAEPLPLLDDLDHLLVDRLQIVRGERIGDVEVVVETVGDRRADAELGVGVQRLHGLGGDVGGRVPQDRQALVGIDQDGLNGGAGRDLPVQVAGLTVDPDRDDGSVLAEQVQPGSRLVDHPGLEAAGARGRRG